MIPKTRSVVSLREYKPLAKSQTSPGKPVRKKSLHDFHIISHFIHRLQLIYNAQNFVSASIVFTGFFSVVYEFDQLRDDFVNMFLSSVVTVLTIIYLAMIGMEIRIDKILKKIQTNYLVRKAKTRNWFSLYILMLVIHPNYMFNRAKLLDEKFSSENCRQSYFRRNFNDYLFLFQATVHLLKVLTNLMCISMFAQPATENFSRFFNFSSSRSFVVKCFLKENTLFALSSFLTLMAFYFALVFCITEAPITVHPDKYNLGFQHTHSFLEAWYFSSVCLVLFGYGDKVPQSYLGKIFTMIASYIGAFLLPLVTFAVYELVKFTFAENSISKCAKKQELMIRREGIISRAIQIFSLPNLNNTANEGDPVFNSVHERFPDELRNEMNYLRENFKKTEETLWQTQEDEAPILPDLLMVLSEDLLREVDTSISWDWQMKNEHFSINERSADVIMENDQNRRQICNLPQ